MNDILLPAAPSAIPFLTRRRFDRQIAKHHPGVRAASRRVTLTLFNNLDEVTDLWQSFKKSATATAFQGFAWHETWQRHIGALIGVQPSIVAGYYKGRLVALFPLGIETKWGVRQLVWHAGELCDYNAPLLADDFADIVPPEAFPFLFRDVVEIIAARTACPLDAITLNKMPESVAGKLNPFTRLSTTLNPSGAYVTALKSSWEEFYSDKRSTSTRRRDRTKLKRLGEMGPVRFSTAETEQERREFLDLLISQKSQAFRRMGVPDLFAKPGVQAFFHDMARQDTMRDIVHISRLDVGDVTAAINFALTDRNAYYHVLASYDPGDVSRYGPGVAHLHHLMAYAIGLGCRWFDFTIGDERYKSEWCEKVMPLHDYRAARTLKGLLATSLATGAARLKRLVKQTPTLWNIACRLRALRSGN